MAGRTDLTAQPLGHKTLSKDPQQKIARHLCDCVGLLVKGEVAGIKDVELGGRHVALVGERARDDERRIVASPENQRGRPVLTQPGLPPGIGGNVGLIVVEQLTLDLPFAGSREDLSDAGRGRGQDRCAGGLSNRKRGRRRECCLAHLCASFPLQSWFLDCGKRGHR